MEKDKNLNLLINFLFLLNAVKVAPPRKPFWYTSGLFGPLYINTHFLIGGEKSATSLLNYIDRHKEEKKDFPNGFLKRLIQKYNTSKPYRLTVDLIIKKIEKKLLDSKIDLISGGERRDWFFSLIVAYKLKLKTLLLYKDKSFVFFDTVAKKVNIPKKPLRRKILHLADLTNFGSSYIRFWIPAVKSSGCRMSIAFNVINRQPESKEALKRKGVTSLSLIKTNTSFFREASKKKLITKKQFDTVKGYLNNPERFITNFIRKNPYYLKEALASNDKKTRERARLFISKQAKKYLD